MKYIRIFGWTITTDMGFQYAIANPPRHCWKIPLLPVILIKWKDRKATSK